MNDIVIPEITIGFWELPTAALIMMAFLISGMVISNKRDWLRTKLWRTEAMYWVFGAISIALLIPAIGHIFGILYLTSFTDLTTSDQRSFAVILAAVVGAPFVIWRTWVAQRQVDTDEQGQITDRITKAVEQLGAEKTIWESGKQSSKPNLEVRLGGIYALERISQDSGRDHITVMEILCAYVRENSKADSATILLNGTEPYSEGWESWEESVPSAGIDIQAVIDVIARRRELQILKEQKEEYRLDLSDCNLQRVDFRKGDFDRAIMNRSHMDFAMLDGVRLDSALLNLTELNGATFMVAALNNAELFGAKLNGADLRWANLNEAVLSGAQLKRTKFMSAQTSHTSTWSTDLAVSSDLTAEQVNSMFGHISTNLIDGMEEMPDLWPNEDLEYWEFAKRWRIAKNANP